MLIRFARDRRGVTAIVTAIGFIAAAGAAGIAIDIASWLAAKRSLQNASDQAAYSAVVGVTAGQSGYTNALAVLAQSGYGCSSAGTRMDPATWPVPVQTESASRSTARQRRAITPATARPGK